MILDRNIPNRNGICKYSLVLNRKIFELRDNNALTQDISDAMDVLDNAGLIDDGLDPEKEFFVIRLKDKFAAPALFAYANAASHDDPEYAAEITKLAEKAEKHPSTQFPT